CFTGMCGSMIVHNASSSSGLAMACLLARQTHRKADAILLEALNRASEVKHALTGSGCFVKKGSQYSTT
ncbi:MAG: hypothetical protein ACKVW3_08185, partial [Phycisphaerales bacterium]